MSKIFFPQHALLETEAENVRCSISNAVQQTRLFGEEVADSVRKLGTCIQHVEGDMVSGEGSNDSHRVRGGGHRAHGVWGGIKWLAQGMQQASTKDPIQPHMSWLGMNWCPCVIM